MWHSTIHGQSALTIATSCKINHRPTTPERSTFFLYFSCVWGMLPMPQTQLKSNRMKKFINWIRSDKTNYRCENTLKPWLYFHIFEPAWVRVMSISKALTRQWGIYIYNILHQLHTLHMHPRWRTSKSKIGITTQPWYLKLFVSVSATG